MYSWSTLTFLDWTRCVWPSSPAGTTGRTAPTWPASTGAARIATLVVCVGLATALPVSCAFDRSLSEGSQEHKHGSQKHKHHRLKLPIRPIQSRCPLRHLLENERFRTGRKSARQTVHNLAFRLSAMFDKNDPFYYSLQNVCSGPLIKKPTSRGGSGRAKTMLGEGAAHMVFKMVISTPAKSWRS